MTFTRIIWGNEIQTYGIYPLPLTKKVEELLDYTRIKTVWKNIFNGYAFFNVFFMFLCFQSTCDPINNGVIKYAKGHNLQYI